MSELRICGFCVPQGIASDMGNDGLISLLCEDKKLKGKDEMCKNYTIKKASYDGYILVTFFANKEDMKHDG